MFIKRIIAAQKEYDLKEYLLRINSLIAKNSNANKLSANGIVSNS